MAVIPLVIFDIGICVNGSDNGPIASKIGGVGPIIAKNVE